MGYIVEAQDFPTEGRHVHPKTLNTLIVLSVDDDGDTKTDDGRKMKTYPLKEWKVLGYVKIITEKLSEILTIDDVAQIAKDMDKTQEIADLLIEDASEEAIIEQASALKPEELVAILEDVTDYRVMKCETLEAILKFEELTRQF